MAFSPVLWGLLAAAPVSVQLAQATVSETVLYFETASATVRVYRQGSALFFQLYNRTTGVMEVDGAPAELVLATPEQTVYRTTAGEVQRLAKINWQAATELEIVAADGSQVLREPGSQVRIGVPPGQTTFAGNTIAPGATAVVISGTAAYLRASPQIDSARRVAAPRLAVMAVEDRIGNPADGYLWYQVTYGDSTGWVRGDLLQPI